MRRAQGYQSHERWRVLRAPFRFRLSGTRLRRPRRRRTLRRTESLFVSGTVVNESSAQVDTASFSVLVTEKDGELTVYADRKIDGTARKPLAYILGYNALIFRPEKK